MASVFPLAFPYSVSGDGRATLSKAIIANDDDSSRYAFKVSHGKCSSISKIVTKTQAPLKEALKYVSNELEEHPLLLCIPTEYAKLKLQMHLTAQKDVQRSLIILKTSGNDVELAKLADYLLLKNYDSKLREVSEIAYSKLQLDDNQDNYDVIINDTLNTRGYRNSRLNVSIWEHDNASDSHTFMFSFQVWIEKSPRSESPLLFAEPQFHEAETLGSTFTLADYRKAFHYNIDDGPEFRKTLAKYEKELPKFKRALNTLQEEARVMESSFKRMISSRNKIIECMEMLVDSQFNPLMKRLGLCDNFSRIFMLLFDSMERNMRFLFKEVLNVASIAKMASYCLHVTPHEGSELSSNKKAFEKNSKEYYDWLTKYLSNEKDRPQLKLLLKRRTFELSKFDYLNSLNLASNNQYFNQFMENVLKFSGLAFDKTLAFKHFKDAKLGQKLLSEDAKMYLNSLSRFNSEKLQLRQKIEACISNEELTNLIRSNALNPLTVKSTDELVHYSTDDLLMTSGQLDLVFFAAPVVSVPLSKAASPVAQPDDQNSEISGILFALGGKGKPGWHKEWVVLKEGQLLEFSDWRKGRQHINKPIDIALANVKPTNYDKRQFCFEITTSLGNKHVFQAMSEDDRNQWIKALYNAGQVTQRLLAKPRPKIKTKLHIELPPIISADINDRLGSPVSIVSSCVLKDFNDINYLETVRSIQGSDNHICADCGSRESVEWISNNFLVVVCVKCSSCHRNMGSHISKVRSLKLDNFENENRVLLGYINNVAVNSYLEFGVKHKLSPNSSDEARLSYIKEKYSAKSFLRPLPNANEVLIKAIRKIDIAEVIRALNSGADPNVRLQMGLSSTGVEPIKVMLFEYSLRKLVELKEGGALQEYFVISELLLLKGCKIEQIEELHEDLNLSEEAKAYWKEKQLRAQGMISPT